MPSASDPTQAVFETCYRGRQSALHHTAYMRMAKVLFALRVLDCNRIKLSGKRIFDYGFGAGTFFRYCPHDCHLAGVEQDPETVAAVTAMLQARGHTNIDLQPIKIDAWQSHPLLAKTYDIFLCSHVLEHLPDPAEFLRTVHRCVAPGGVFLGLVPINEREKNPHHLHAPDRQMIQRWAEESGYRLLWYEENDPFIDRFQPLFARDSGLRHKLAQLVSLGFGIPATLLGHRLWFMVGKAFAAITTSHPTQAGFLLKVD